MNADYYHKNVRKRWGIMLVAILFSSFVYAQKISVSRFYMAESDLTAQNKNTSVDDQNGDKCALIRVQTTQKGFTFDVGSAGVQRVDDNHVGEIWVYVPFGVRHISIRHSQLGSLANYDFPVNIEKARTYILEITSDKVFVNRYDDTRKQKLNIKVVPTNATFTLNGMNVKLDSRGEASQELSFGTYTYKVAADKYYPKEGQIVIDDSVNAQQLLVNNLEPIKGKVSVHVHPYNAKVTIDDVAIPQNTSLVPYDLQIGSHRLLAKCDGYKTETLDIEVEQGKTLDVEVKLDLGGNIKFTCKPTAYLFVKDERRGTIPCMNRNEIYAEASVRAGSFMAYGVSLGGYLSNVNMELSALFGTGSIKAFFWSDDNKSAVLFHPKMLLAGKVGYGFAIGTWFRLTPQVGVNYLKMDVDSPDEGLQHVFAEYTNACNVCSVLLGLRFSAIIANHFGVSLSPEYSFAVGKSANYKAWGTIHPEIKNWGRGLNVKLGIMVAF